ncbi:hypothetical protein G15_0030 [Enterococcus avium]|nr:hypothetical protein G15_0030 [Enterococcus avium]
MIILTVLDELVEKNTYPIVFIGSGMSMRYADNFPNWNGLIKNLWKKAFQDDNENNYYKFMLQLKEKISKENPDKNKNFISYKLNIIASTIIEEKFNEQFLEGTLSVSGYSAKDYFESGISPFKIEISNTFSKLNIRSEMLEEFNAYKKFLSKTKIILTTNYDEMIEEAYNSVVTSHPIDTYVGQEGFLREDIGYAELYKIHGSSSRPSSIIITEKDYSKFNKNSVLISAKIISGLITSPILFLGYSLTDENIRSIIRDFSGSLSKEDTINASERIIIVERVENEMSVVESKLMEKDLGIELTLLKTDNYKLLFDSLNKINEGVSSAFINRYSTLFKKLIVERGKEGTLKTLLVSPTELSELEKNHDLRKNAAVVIADAAIVYAYPNLIDYFINYFSDQEKLNTDVGLHFIGGQLPKTNIPFWWYVDNLELENSTLNSREKDKIKARMDRFSDVKKIKNKIHSSNHIKASSFADIESLGFKIKKKIDVIAYNIDVLDQSDVLKFILEELSKLKENNDFKIDTPLRRLCIAYDIKYIHKTN